MSKLNELSCLVVGGGNTGVGSCYLNIQNIVGAIIVPNDFKLVDADMQSIETVVAKLKELTMSDPSTRIYPITEFVSITNNSEDVTTETFGYGGIAVTREGKYDWTFRFVKGGLCLSKALRKFNGKNLSIIFIDANGVIFGTKVGDDFAGIPLELNWTLPFIINDGTASTQYQIRFVFEPSYLNDEPAFIDGQGLSAWKDIQGLQDVAIKASIAGAVITATALTGCSKTNISDLFGATLADPDAWKVTNATTGVALTVTAVALVGNAYELTLSEAPAPGAKTNVALASPTDLSTLGVVGFESNVATVTSA